MRKFGKMAVASLCAAMVLSGCGNKTVNNTSQTVPVKEKISLGDTVDLGENQENLDKVETLVNNMYNDGAQILLHVSDNEQDNILMFFNKDKHCYAEIMTGGIMYYDNLGNVRIYRDPYIDDYGVHPLGVADNLIEMAKHGKATVEKREISIEETYNAMLEEVIAQLTADQLEENVRVYDDEGNAPEETVADETEETTEESAMTPEEIKEAAVEAVENYLGWTYDEIKDKYMNQISLTVTGRENIYTMYALTIGKENAAEFVDELFEGDTNKEDDQVILSVSLNEQDGKVVNGSMMYYINNSPESSSIGWYFDEYIGITGFTSLKSDWLTVTDKEKLVDDINSVKEEIGTLLQNFVETHFDEDTAKEILEGATVEETETPEVEIGESGVNLGVEGDAPVAEFDSIIRKGSFNESVSALLKEDGLEEVDPESFEVPEGYTEDDKHTMIELYSKLSDWDSAQSDGTLVSPLSPDELEFARSYIKACEDIFTNDTTGSDKCGMKYWKDTIGVFIAAIEK